MKKREWGESINLSLPSPRHLHKEGSISFLASPFNGVSFRHEQTTVLFRQIGQFSTEADNTLHPNLEDLIQDHTTGCPNTRAYQNIKMNYFSMHRLLLCTVFCLPSFQVLSLPLALRQSSYDFLDVLLFPPRLCSFLSMALRIFKILVSLSSTIKKSLS